jgi:2,4'-dihydroxyacetophenone dioxygenase
MRVTRQGVVTRHAIPGQCSRTSSKGGGRYLEHALEAAEDGFVFEPPGETHTLVIPEDCTEMLTLCQVTGALIYVTPDGQPIGYEMSSPG